MRRAYFIPYILQFKQASGTSRGVLRTKDTWFIIVEGDHKIGIGECGMFRGLSFDDVTNYESKLQWACEHIDIGLEALLSQLNAFPSIQFGLEMAFKSFESSDRFELYPSDFTKNNKSIPINGLIWMGSKKFMNDQIKTKLSEGFDCIKMKIGAIDFETELGLLKLIRNEFSSETIELRVDANGAFKPMEALEKLKRLSDYDLHSIEQPIRQGQWQEMAELCEQTPLPIALDEELIGIVDDQTKSTLLNEIQPQYIILKPTLVGGFRGSESWIERAEQQHIGWWITSALESNIGLNAIAQWTYTLQSNRPQGLGTGGLFTNNFDSPLVVKNGTLRYENNLNWDINNLKLKQ
ncbi:o-succinylbenzoate synthase [Psychroserpens sp.]|uniref:o-succinylbenzoate synthase n=1 Tax=Psychroserpens sp. TaxID=2020870 RepID=UPI001B1E3B5E|nr:o-succinylbenzoate synthase [Psychroserpens sp.]MBO6631337.1 o-succinylbenzoate synthase [Psychroserpens sp.]MBO6653322.1 o-succinylbenzoate synthase [Psychroserpens sp.]MBO6680651.1 o-succinylbenzoate synthase [Psychroserpens sp.]MBO6750391.1 o-succinylbenzoate synthase [Psychroserpens sp.]